MEVGIIWYTRVKFKTNRVWFDYNGSYDKLFVVCYAQ